MKLSKERIKQILLSIIAFSFIIIGYLNYDLKGDESIIEVSANDNEINLGDVQLVSSGNVETSLSSGIVSNDEIEVAEENEDLKNKIENNDENYFEETKLERDRMYSEMIEVYQKLINSQSTPSDQKAISAEEISNITNIKNGIMISENLIKNKGFENVVILVNNSKVTVIVKAPVLNQEQISKIQNIVQRELNVEVENISITNK